MRQEQVPNQVIADITALYIYDGYPAETILFCLLTKTIIPPGYDPRSVQCFGTNMVY